MWVEPRETIHHRCQHTIYMKGSGKRTWILKEVEHGEEFAWRHHHVVAKPACDDRVVHNGLVGLVLEVAVPSTAEFWARPFVHHGKLFLSGADLNTSFDAVGGKGPGAVDIPLLEHGLLDFRISTHEVVKRLDMRLSTIRREREAGKLLGCAGKNWSGKWVGGTY